ncbi:MAG: L,D-transpeptidase [Turicibacter sp.]
MINPIFQIKIDLSNRSLTVFKDGKWLREYPIAIGKKQTPTPTGTFKIINKAENPGGPFGAKWLGINSPGIGIHGTNNPSSIGRAVSNGCIRLYIHDIIELYNLIDIGTEVIIS